MQSSIALRGRQRAAREFQIVLVLPKQRTLCVIGPRIPITEESHGLRRPRAQSRCQTRRSQDEDTLALMDHTALFQRSAVL
jgi:hypothetical protein